MIQDLINWTIHWASTPYGVYALFILSFVESSFFPVPPDLLLIALCLLNPKISLFYATVCAIASVLGGMVGYFIGFFGGRPLAERLFKKEKIEIVHNYFQKYEAWAIFIAAFTPIPYKVFTIAGGVFYINFLKFIIASIFGRSGRFFIVGCLIMLFGERVKGMIKGHFEAFTIIFTLLLIGGFYCLKHIKIKK
ncbi:MAG: YqaA family protein [bacterium]